MDPQSGSDALKKLGVLHEYLSELMSEVAFFSEILLPAPRQELEKTAADISAGKDEPYKTVRLILERYIPHNDAERLAQLWNKVKPKLVGKEYDKEAEKEYTALVKKYSEQWTHRNVGA